MGNFSITLSGTATDRGGGRGYYEMTREGPNEAQAPCAAPPRAPGGGGFLTPEEVRKAALEGSLLLRVEKLQIDKEGRPLAQALGIIESAPGRGC